MKLQSKPCECSREKISLLASGALENRERTGVEDHVAACSSCRELLGEMTKLAAPLRNWEESFAHIEPCEPVKARWARAIQQAAKSRAEPASETEDYLHLLWRELIWPCRRTWAGLAATWLTILIFNQLQPAQPSMTNSTLAASPSEMRLALLEQHRVLDALIGPRQLEQPVEPPRRPNNQPRSKLCSVAMG